MNKRISINDLDIGKKVYKLAAEIGVNTPGFASDHLIPTLMESAHYHIAELGCTLRILYESGGIKKLLEIYPELEQSFKSITDRAVMDHLKKHELED